MPMAKHRRRSYTSVKAYLRDASYYDGKSQAQVAAELGISEPWLSDIKNGKVQPGWNLARRISAKCNIPIEVFIEERDRASS